MDSFDSIGASGGLLWTREWTFRFKKIQDIFWLAESVSFSQGILYFMEVVSQLASYVFSWVRWCIKYEGQLWPRNSQWSTDISFSCLFVNMPKYLPVRYYTLFLCTFVLGKEFSFKHSPKAKYFPLWHITVSCYFQYPCAWKNSLNQVPLRNLINRLL